MHVTIYYYTYRRQDRTPTPPPSETSRRPWDWACERRVTDDEARRGTREALVVWEPIRRIVGRCSSGMGRC